MNIYLCRYNGTSFLIYSTFLIRCPVHFQCFSEVHEHNPECILAMDQCYNTEMKKHFFKQMFQNDKPVEVKKEDIEAIMKEIDAIISKIVGMEGLKLQLSKWIKGLALNERRKALDLKVGTKKPLHMAFLGNPGTGMRF